MESLPRQLYLIVVLLICLALALTEAVDVYGDWIDACEAAENAVPYTPAGSAYKNNASDENEDSGDDQKTLKKSRLYNRSSAAAALRSGGGDDEEEEDLFTEDESKPLATAVPSKLSRYSASEDDEDEEEYI